MAEHIALTPTLLLGPPEAAYGHDGWMPVSTADDALTAIQNGLVALLPPQSWASAIDVLQRLGCTPGEIQFKLALAGQPELA